MGEFDGGAKTSDSRANHDKIGAYALMWGVDNQCYSSSGARNDGTMVGQRASRYGGASMIGYQQDYTAWVEETARAIEEGRFEQIDRAALADEVLDGN